MQHKLLKEWLQRWKNHASDFTCFLVNMARSQRLGKSTHSIEKICTYRVNYCGILNFEEDVIILEICAEHITAGNLKNQPIL